MKESGLKRKNLRNKVFFIRLSNINSLDLKK